MNMSMHQIGGAMGFLDEWGETLFEKGHEAVKTTAASVAEAAVDLSVQVLPTESKDVKKTEIGGETELKFDKREQEYKEKVRVTTFKRELTQAQRKAMEDEAKRKAVSKQRENVIRTIGGITNLSYQDVVDEKGVMRLDIEAWFNKKNSEMQKEDLKKQKQGQVSKAHGKINYFMQHNMAGERAGGQHMLSAVG